MPGDAGAGMLLGSLLLTLKLLSFHAVRGRCCPPPLHSDAGKHGRARRQRRKLPLAMDAGMGETAAHVLTEAHADDATQTPARLGQTKGVMAGGACGGEFTYRVPLAEPRQLWLLYP